MTNGMRLADKLAAKSGLTRKQAETTIRALFGENGIIPETLRKGERVTLSGFGSFETRRREARKGRNPRTGKEIQIEAATAAVFRPGKSFKETLGRK